MTARTWMWRSAWRRSAVQNTGLDAQVALFAARLNTSAVGFDPNTTLFTIWGGANDIFLMFALLFVVMIPIVWLAKPPFRAVGTGSAH